MTKTTARIGKYGYREGSMQEIAAQALVDGGESYTEIVKQLTRDYPQYNSWPVACSIARTRLTTKLGYAVDAHWQLVPSNPAAVYVPDYVEYVTKSGHVLRRDRNKTGRSRRNPS